MLIPALLLLLMLPGCALWSRDPSIRTPGVIIDDQVVERMALKRIRKSDPAYKGAHVVAVCYNGVLLLTGQVATADLKERAAATVLEIDKVRRVHNELEVGGPISFVARSNDSWLTTKVKARLIGSGDVDADHVKVVTENSVVYLLGMVERSEGAHAADAASRVHGVRKIVKVFEYLDPP